MSLSTTLSNALSGLQVAQQALAVTANNVANANTPGYSRKVAEPGGGGHRQPRRRRRR